MLQYQLRVVEEKAQLEERLGKLVTFLESPQIGNVSPAEQSLLVEQAEAMSVYTSILGQRIAGWKPE